METKPTGKTATDADLIEEEETFPEARGSAGGNLARDVATQTEQDRVRDPEARGDASKQKDIDNAAAVKSARVAEHNSG